MTTTGLDDVDFWIGGLAEKIMPFGGMLGSTFNFVFETQLEALQNGDRFYYLERTAGLNFVTELENNSFAKMMMTNTDATHLPASSSRRRPHPRGGPDAAVQRASRRRRPSAGSALTRPASSGTTRPRRAPTRTTCSTPAMSTWCWAARAGNDILIASIGDDTLWGDAGNDRLEGGFGNDQIRGGVGDDIITDIGGDDNIQGDDGNDVIHAGNGINLILGGFGNDFIVTGEDASEAFGGPGNDFILGSDDNEQDMGNEGDDWLEQGNLDGSPGDNFDPLGPRPDHRQRRLHRQRPGRHHERRGRRRHHGRQRRPGRQVPRRIGLRLGHLQGRPERRRHRPGHPRPERRARARRGRHPGPLLGGGRPVGLGLQRHPAGDNANAATIATAGAQGSVLTNIGLINGLQEFLGAGITSFGSGNIILGGDGSDLIEGRGGNDLIDGDRWLNVRISVRRTPTARALRSPASTAWCRWFR